MIEHPFGEVQRFLKEQLNNRIHVKAKRRANCSLLHHKIYITVHTKVKVHLYILNLHIRNSFGHTLKGLRHCIFFFHLNLYEDLSIECSIQLVFCGILKLMLHLFLLDSILCFELTLKPYIILLQLTLWNFISIFNLDF